MICNNVVFLRNILALMVLLQFPLFRGPPPHNMVHRAPPPAGSGDVPPQQHPQQQQAPRQMSRGQSKDEEDTMKNLRKTFAGIFGDM